MYQSDLIYDIGANDGSDARYYLSKGFRVLAVDADATLIATLDEAHGWWRQQGRLITQAVGVATKPGVLPFYRNSFSEWSSFAPQSKATSRLEHQVEEVAVTTLSALFEEFGVPYYLKLDVEELEAAILRTLVEDKGLPAFLSFEMNPGWEGAARHLGNLGYTAFQLIRQGERHLAPVPKASPEGTAEYVTRFTNRHSGAFGQDLPPHEWLHLDDLIALTRLEEAAANERNRLGLEKGWFDIHCRHRNVPQSGVRRNQA